MTKYELSISTGYVPDWGITEAFRELFQNALDNEIKNPENKMICSYNEEEQTITICNKTSKLTSESLLLGSSTKADDDETIGQHGEGYKIAFMILLRNNKKITVYNYGAREIWQVRLVKSKKYNNQLVTTVFVDKEAVWKRVPDCDLTIKVEGITAEEYKDIVKKNLHLRTDTVERYDIPSKGAILLDARERGNIYVKGLFVNKIDSLHYGYDFEPSVIKLDRDRKLVDSFNVSWESSLLWKYAASKDSKMTDLMVDMVKHNVLDTAYLDSRSTCNSSIEQAIYDAIGEDFINCYGDDAVPVINNAEYDAVKELHLGSPIIVTSRYAESLSRSTKVNNPEIVVTNDKVQKKFQEFAGKIAYKLTDEERKQLYELIDLIKY